MRRDLHIDKFVLVQLDPACRLRAIDCACHFAGSTQCDQIIDSLNVLGLTTLPISSVKILSQECGHLTGKEIASRFGSSEQELESLALQVEAHRSQK